MAVGIQRYAWHLFALCAAIICLTAIPSPNASAHAEGRPLATKLATNGVLDLSHWSPAEDGAIGLDGTWRFYWGQLLTPQMIAAAPGTVSPAGDAGWITVPGVWEGNAYKGEQLSNIGYGTYRLLLKLPVDAPGRTFALDLPSIATSYSLWIDGRLLVEQGKVGDSRMAMKPQNYSRIAYFTPASQQVELVLQVANFVQRKGGVWSSIAFGEAGAIDQQREARIYRQAGLAAALLMIGLYHLGWYGFRQKYKPPLFFGLASLCIGLRTLFTGDFLGLRLWPGMSWELAVKAEYLSAFMGIGFLILYAYSLYPQDIPKKPAYGLFAFICLISAPVAALPALLYTQAMLYFQLLLLAALALISAGVARAAFHNRKSARLNLCLLLFFLATAVNDVFFYNFVLQTGDLLPYGLLVTIGGQIFIMASRISDTFNQAEQLSAQLAEANQELEAKVEERTRELRHSNEQLQQSEQARQAMLSNIAHEFGTPLTSLIGYASAMKEGVFPSHSDEALAYMNVIYEKGLILLRLSEDLKQLVSLERDQMSFQFAREEWTAYYNKLETKFGMDVRKQGIAFAHQQLVYTPATAEYIEVDNARMDQVFTNLLANAVRHTPKSGTISITGRLFLLQRKAVIVIADSGHGIALQDLPYVFERFYRGDAVAAAGSGLGLAISREIVERHGGRLGVWSEEGKGSRFFVILPLLTGQQSFHPKNTP